MWDDDTSAWLRECMNGGDEMVLHGLVHADRRGRDGLEFTAETGLRGALWAVAEGRSALAAIGLAPAGFVAPAYGHPRAWRPRSPIRASPGGRPAANCAPGAGGCRCPAWDWARPRSLAGC